MENVSLKKLARVNKAVVSTSRDKQKKLVMHTGNTLKTKIMKGKPNG